MGGYDEFDNPPGPAYMAHYEAFNIPEPISRHGAHLQRDGTHNLGFADLTSTSGTGTRMRHQTQDASESICSTVGDYPYFPTPYSEIDITQQFSQEFRLTSKGDGQLHWVGGRVLQRLTAPTGTSIGTSDFGPVVPRRCSRTASSTAAIRIYHVRQYALFADGSYKITDQWKFEAGLRWYRYQSATRARLGLPASTPRRPSARYR